MRLFVAVELGEAIKRVLLVAQSELERFKPILRGAKPEQMHLTLKFLGEVAETRLPAIQAALDTAVSQVAPFRIGTMHAGCFPPRGRVRVVWVGLDHDEGLLKCQAGVERELAKAGFPAEDRPFSPHLTVARVSEDSSGGKLRQAVEALPVDAVEQCVSEVVLMQSRLGRDGAQHARIAGWPLRGLATA